MMAGRIEMLAAGIVLMAASWLTGEKLNPRPFLVRDRRPGLSGYLWLDYRH